MLEFVLMLPFVFIILLLTVNFGLAFAERQRSLVAVREVALRHAAAAAAGGDASVEAVAAAIHGDTLQPRSMAGEFLLGGDDAGCPAGDGSRFDGGGVREVFGTLAGFVGRMSSTQVYSAAIAGQPVAGALLPQRDYNVCFAIDVSPWTYKETGDYLDLILKGFKGMLGI